MAKHSNFRQGKKISPKTLQPNGNRFVSPVIGGISSKIPTNLPKQIQAASRLVLPQ